MVIYLKHSIFGTKVASSEDEAKADEKKGWERYELAALLKPSVNALVKTEEPIENLRKVWEEKFGKRPHHKKSAESLRKELEAA